jgi:protein SCO1/2
MVISFFASAHGGGHQAAETLGFEDKTGSYIPLNLAFTTAEGESVVLADLVKKPTILIFQYYRCADLCEQIGMDLASALDRAAIVAGRDYRVLSFSIDPEETPGDAKTIRNRTLPMFTKPFPDDAWDFLTGDDESIDAITDAVGFHYRKVGDDFDHPIGLVFVSPDGKITRYVHGLAYLPAELSLSVMGASTGTVAPAVAKVLRFCFRYDSTSKTLVFNATRVTGSLTLAIAFAFIVFLYVRGRKRSHNRD